MSEPLWQPRNDLQARLLGLGACAVGAGLLWMQARSILSAIAAQRTVTYFHAAIALGELALVLGVYWTARGLAGYRAVRALQQDPRAMRWFGVVALAVTGGSLVALHSWLQAQGCDS